MDTSHWDAIAVCPWPLFVHIHVSERSLIFMHSSQYTLTMKDESDMYTYIYIYITVLQTAQQ